MEARSWTLSQLSAPDPISMSPTDHAIYRSICKKDFPSVGWIVNFVSDMLITGPESGKF